MVSVVRLLLAVVALASCGRPGVVVERCNGTLEPVIVREAYNDASETSERLAPGSRGEFGPAVSGTSRFRARWSRFSTLATGSRSLGRSASSSSASKSSPLGVSSLFSRGNARR